MTDYEFAKAQDKHHVATPRWVVESIYNLLNITWYSVCWFPFNNYDSEFKLRADELKLKYAATHIFDERRNDFFTTNPPVGCELMISNPPFGIQNEIIKRSFYLVDQGLIKAFALLLPLSTLETETRSIMWSAHSDKLKIIIFKKRIKFIGKKTSFNTACCWVLYNVKGYLPTVSWI